MENVKEEENYAYKYGKGWAADVEFDIFQIASVGHKTKNRFGATVSIGEEYYETDPYPSKDLALCEVKGWLEGVKAKIEGVIKSIERQINENNQDTAGAGHEG